MSGKIDQQLQSIFNNVNDWLKFAEAKNAALVAADVAILMGIATLLTESLNSWLQIYLIFAIIFVALSLIVALTSFLPATRIPWLRKPAQIREDNNVLYFGHIADHDVESYLELLKKVMEEDQNPSAIGRAYVEQVIANSKIAVKKYGYFTTSLFLLMTALTTIFGAILLLTIDALLNQ